MYQYSKRLSWSTGLNEIAQLTASRDLTSSTLLDLSSSNPTSCFADYPHAFIRKALADIDEFGYEPAPFGLYEARLEVSRYYARRQIEVDPDRIVLTASTSEAYALLFKLLCDPGDQVLIPSPSYPLFEYLAALENVCLTPYHLNYDGAWYYDFADLRNRINERTRAIIIVNPNNPTGSFLTAEERNELVEIATRQQLPIISDEVFMDYDLTPRAGLSKTLIDCDGAPSFSLNGLSKAAGMPQLKLAWIVLNGPASERALARERLELISDTYLSVASPVQKALPSLLDAGESFQKSVRRRLNGNVLQVDTLLYGTAAHRLTMDGGWSAILQVPRTRTEDQWISNLWKNQEVVVQPGYYFDLSSEAYLVVSLLTEPAVLSEGLRRIAAELYAAA